METFLYDLRHSIRMLVKKPGFTIIVILTLALGIGANTAIFSFVNAILLRPLPYREPDRLMRIESVRGAESGRISMLELRELKQQLQIFDDVAAFIPGAQYNFSGGGSPEELAATLCTHNLFEVLGVSLTHGEPWPEVYDLERNFGVVLTHDLWQRKFGGSPSVLGEKITLDAAPFYTVYGVLPPHIQFPNNVQLFRSIAINQNYPNYKDRDARNVYAIARLKAGVSYEQAQAEVKAFGDRLAEDYPNNNAGLRFNLTPLSDFYVGDVRPYLLMLLGAVVFVLLIACGNVVNLLLSRALAREREIAVRLALGAGRSRLIRQFLTESVLLSLLGGAIGLALAAWWVKMLAVLIQKELPIWMAIEIDVWVLVFTLAISILTGILAGIAPAFQASNPNLNDLLKEGARGSSGGTRHHLRRALVVAEIALALVVLVGAGLMARSFLKLQQVELGFNPERLLTMRVALPWRKYSNDQGAIRTAQFYEQVLEKMSSLPGVEAAGITSNLPFSGEAETGKLTFTAEGQSVDEQLLNPYINDLRVSPNYFDLMRIRTVIGRVFTNSDTKDAVFAAVISERLAERVWPGQDPIGRRLKIGGPASQGRWMTVIGVVSNVKHEDLTSESGLDLYVSYLQVPDSNMYLLLRTQVEPMTLAEPATKIVWNVDPDQSTFNTVTMEQRIADTVWQRRVSGTLFVVFALLALTLAAIGIYGVISYSVRQRTREIGIRMALGASTHQVLKMVIVDALVLILIGGAIGMVAALAMGRIISSLLYGISAADPYTFIIVTLILAIIGILAGLIPARRAARVDPLVALRYE